MHHLIPLPVAIDPAGGAFMLTAESAITVDAGVAGDELAWIAGYLADRLAPATGLRLPIERAEGQAAAGRIHLTLDREASELGAEGYGLWVHPDRVTIVAQQPAGLFWGVQTMRQLLPAAIEHSTSQRGPWVVPAGFIRDYPRFAWRGMMLDVARHFFPVRDVKRLLDLLACYKLNRLHLHLTDDQGWRLMIDAWPRLAGYGGSTQVGGGPGGYYTQADYAEIVDYARRRYVTVVPEIDLPGHTQAALASYPELSCDGQARPLYTGIEVGFSSLCTERETVYRFVEDVFREVAALTPGPYLHIGGDEAPEAGQTAYAAFIERVQAIVRQHGKQAVGWEEIAQAPLLPTSVAQHWKSGLAARAVQQGARVIMSPASRAYLDMKYRPDTEFGLDWAGRVDVRQAYAWDPATLLPDVPESRVLGIEAPLWTETLRTADDLEFMAFPRLLGHAEIGWSAAGARDWEGYRRRLGGHGPRLAATGVNFYRSPQVPWQGPG